MVWLILVAVVGTLFGIGKVADGRALRPIESKPRFAHEVLGFLTVFWGVVTAMIFVPAGLLLGVVALPNPPTTALAFGLIAICLNGLVFVRRTWRVPRLFAERDVDELRRVGAHAMFHHGLVAFGFALIYLVEAFPLEAVLAPCAIGAALGLTIGRVIPRLEVLPKARVAHLQVKKL